MTLLRSNINFADRVFLDRVSTDDQGAPQLGEDIDKGTGDPYVYGGVYDPFNLGSGADCSGANGIFIGAALLGPESMSWTRQFTTVTFPGPFQGFRQVAQADLLSGNYPIKVCIHRSGQGGAADHMQMTLDGIVMESNGDNGTCTTGSGAMDPADNYWNTWYVYDGPITEDTTWRQPMSYPRGFDYAAGRPSGSVLKAAGATFVCRYLTDGGSGLPGKQLLAGELADLVGAQVAVVFNYETTADFMSDGAAAGATCAAQALAYIHSIGGPIQPKVYFSADWNQAANDQADVNAFLTAAAKVLGGPQFVGIYGSYAVCKAALDAGVCRYMWQTEAWSSGNIDSRVDIMQRNAITGTVIGGVACDLNEAHADDYGQYAPWLTVDPPPVAPPTPTSTRPDQATQIALMYDQICLTYAELGMRKDGKSNRTLVDGVAHLIGDPNA